VTTYDRRSRGTRSSAPAVAFVLVAGLLFVAGIAIRLWVLPARGLAGDVDQFVVWIHGIATEGWANAYEQNLSFPAVMAWIWGLMALVQPAFATVVDAADPAISAFMKIPASLADVGIALAVGWWFRDRPWAALASMAAVLLWPVTWYVSAWWGQYESIYVLPAVLAVLAARGNRPGLVAVLLTVSLMTKPQAVPFLVPFAAWYLATQGLLGTVRGVLIAAVTALVLWLPFLAAGGPLAYLANVQTYQNDIFSVLSLRAWNPWWAVQALGAGGEFVLDGTPVLGPLTFRHLGLALAGILSIVVFALVYRAPSARRLALGLAAISLVAFVCLTTMHERYAYPAFVFLLMGASGRGLVAVWAAFAVAFAANLVVAVPPPELLIAEGTATALSLVGTVVITATLVAVLVSLRARDPWDEASEMPLHSLWPTAR
jgi:hypothetical protein